MRDEHCNHYIISSDLKVVIHHTRETSTSPHTRYEHFNHHIILSDLKVVIPHTRETSTLIITSFRLT